MPAALHSIGSAANCSALFTHFPATTTESDFPRPFVIGYGSSPSRCGPSRFAAVGRTRDLPVPAQEASANARFFDHAGLSRRADASVHVAFRLRNSVGAQDANLY